MKVLGKHQAVRKVTFKMQLKSHLMTYILTTELFSFAMRDSTDFSSQASFPDNVLGGLT